MYPCSIYILNPSHTLFACKGVLDTRPRIYAPVRQPYSFIHNQWFISTGTITRIGTCTIVLMLVEEQVVYSHRHNIYPCVLSMLAYIAYYLRHFPPIFLSCTGACLLLRIAIPVMLYQIFHCCNEISLISDNCRDFNLNTQHVPKHALLSYRGIYIHCDINMLSCMYSFQQIVQFPCFCTSRHALMHEFTICRQQYLPLDYGHARIHAIRLSRTLYIHFLKQYLPLSYQEKTSGLFIFLLKFILY